MFPEDNYILSALLLLPPSSQIRIANQARPADIYLFGQFLPEIGKPTYDANSGYITVTATMAGLTGLSSNYPPGGMISAATTNEKTAKVANSVTLQENDLRTLQQLVQNAIAQGISAPNIVQWVLDNLLNFFDKLVIQPHLDTAEWLRGQALAEGKIDWWNNGIHLDVDYHIPTTQVNPKRTGNDAYGDTTSKFWEDVRFIQTALLYNVRAIVMHPTTLDVAAANEANHIEFLNQTGNFVKIRRIIESSSGFQRISTDTRDTVDIILYGLEASKIDDSNPQTTKGVPFIRPGRMLGVGYPPANRFDVGRQAIGQGSTPSAELFQPLGYTHVAPTVEAGGRIGRWGRVYTPEGQPWAVRGEGVTNMIPVIDAVRQVATCDSDMP